MPLIRSRSLSYDGIPCCSAAFRIESLPLESRYASQAISMRVLYRSSSGSSGKSTSGFFLTGILANERGSKNEQIDTIFIEIH